MLNCSTICTNKDLHFAKICINITNPYVGDISLQDLDHIDMIVMHQHAHALGIERSCLSVHFVIEQMNNESAIALAMYEIENSLEQSRMLQVYRYYLYSTHYQC